MKYLTPYTEKECCCGCGLCAVVCPSNAIVMQEDEEGFFYPSIQQEICVGCEKCRAVCAFRADIDRDTKSEPKETVAYAARVKDRQVLAKSSSGGMFTALSDEVLDDGGAVVCSFYDYAQNRMVFRLVTAKEDRDLARGSKYIQSIPGDVYDQVQQWTDANPRKALLFVGTGCQAGAFRKFMRTCKFANPIYVVDILCHGVPSPRIWREYLARKLKSKPFHSLTFKDKRNGWLRPIALVKVNGKEVFLDDYIRLYYSHATLRPSCYNCPYAKLHRDSDITIGDYWGIDKVLPDFYDPQGTSLVLVHSETGAALMKRVLPKLEVRSSDLQECLQPNLLNPTPKAAVRDVWWKDYHQKGFDFVYRKYTAEPLLLKVKKKIWTLLNRT